MSSFYNIETSHTPIPYVLIGDFLKDLDDEHTLCGVAGLMTKGIIDLKCVVGNMCPQRLRARGAKGTLKELGFPDIPVGVGAHVCDVKIQSYEKDVPYLARDDEVEEDGLDLILRTLEQCDDDSVVLVLQSALTDAAMLIDAHRDVFIRKVKQVAIMGGLEVSNEKIVLDSDGYAVPNNANNNTFDMEAARYVYREIQAMNKPLIVTTRDCAYQMKVPFKMYDELNKTGNVVGACLLNRQRPALQGLWEAACDVEGGSKRGTLPIDRNRQWFINVFCGGKNLDHIEDGGNIWDCVDSFVLYDPVNLYASIPELEERFLKPVRFGRDGRHKLFGLSAKNHGVKDVDGFASFLVEIEMNGLALRN